MFKKSVRRVVKVFTVLLLVLFLTTVTVGAASASGSDDYDYNHDCDHGLNYGSDNWRQRKL